MHVIKTEEQIREEIEGKIEELDSINDNLQQIIAVCTDRDKINMYREIQFENEEELFEMQERLEKYERSDF